jgi:V8-like Glu-specific endopeptidase
VSTWLDAWPLHLVASPEGQTFRRYLAQAFRRDDQQYDVATEAHVPPYDASTNPELAWENIFFQARTQDLQWEVVKALVRRDKNVLALLPGADAAPEPATPAVMPVPNTDGDEALTVKGEDTLLDVRVLETGVEKARSVCLLKVRFPGRDRPVVGTAARIGPSQLLTCWHVLHDKANGGEVPVAVTAIFGYQLTATKDEPGTAVQCDIDSIVADQGVDWAVIRTREDIPAGVPELDLTPPEVALERGDYVFIIQHPGGHEKKIGMLHNVVRSVDAKHIAYYTDTDEGSSGAPVFDTEWRVVGLHKATDPLSKKDRRLPFSSYNWGRPIQLVLAGMYLQGVIPGRY